MATHKIAIKNAPFLVKDIKMDYDLRMVVSRSECLRDIAKKFGLQNGEAIAFTNKRLTRFRMVWKHDNLLFLVMPEVNREAEQETFLRIGGTVTLMTPDGSSARKNIVNLGIKRAGSAMARAVAK